MPHVDLLYVQMQSRFMSAFAISSNNNVNASIKKIRDEIGSQSQLNDLVRDLSKEASEVLASRLSEHGILDPKTKITFYRHRDEALSDYFTKEDNFGFCKNVKGLTAMGVPQYKPGEWGLFIDSSKQSLKCVLLHNASTYGGVPIGHSVTLKESYLTVQTVLQKLC